MNRLHHLRETLPTNIEANIDGPPLEFVLLDYNSKDGMEQWAKDNLQEYINSGVLKYYKTTEPDFFNMSHSKNMAAMLTSGQIICNIDADNYAGPAYTQWVASYFTDPKKTPVLTTIHKDFVPYSDLGGRLCFNKTLFTAVRGYDESLIGYGLDDIDLVNRMEKVGGERCFIDNQNFLKHISHTDEERIRNYSLTNKLENIYFAASSDIRSKHKALYLLNDYTFFEVEYVYGGIELSHFTANFLGWVIHKDGLREGTFQRIERGLHLHFENDLPIVLEEEKPGILCSPVNKGRSFWKNISPKDKFYNILIKGYNECTNRYKYSENDRNSLLINPSGWGLGTVYMNFNDSRPIHLGPSLFEHI